jgi:hypothetical protein
MAHAHMAPARSTTASSRAREARRLLFKTDRPRSIDRYIDYFGGAGVVLTAADDDRCGEALLERLA